MFRSREIGSWGSNVQPNPPLRVERMFAWLPSATKDCVCFTRQEPRLTNKLRCILQLAGQRDDPCYVKSQQQQNRTTHVPYWGASVLYVPAIDDQPTAVKIQPDSGMMPGKVAGVAGPALADQPGRAQATASCTATSPPHPIRKSGMQNVSRRGEKAAWGGILLCDGDTARNNVLHQRPPPHNHNLCGSRRLKQPRATVQSKIYCTRASRQGSGTSTVSRKRGKCLVRN